jgi:hypothetical protein
MTPDSALKSRIAAANKLLFTMPYRPHLYVTSKGLRIFVDRRTTNYFPNLDIPFLWNPGTGLLRKSPRSSERPNIPWGSTVELLLCSIGRWVQDPQPWTKGWLDRVQAGNRHWLDFFAVKEFQQHPDYTEQES